MTERGVKGAFLLSGRLVRDCENHVGLKVFHRCCASCPGALLLVLELYHQCSECIADGAYECRFPRGVDSWTKQKCMPVVVRAILLLVEIGLSPVREATYLLGHSKFNCFAPQAQIRQFFNERNLPAPLLAQVKVPPRFALALLKICGAQAVGSTLNSGRASFNSAVRPSSGCARRM